MSALIVIVHVVVCLILILAVLLQSGKAADLAGAFGGTGSQTEFGTRSQATLLSKVTTISAIVSSYMDKKVITSGNRSAGSSVTKTALCEWRLWKMFS